MNTPAQNIYQYRVVDVIKKSADIALYEPFYTGESALYLLQSCVAASVRTEPV